jgi:hypothetical protein
MPVLDLYSKTLGYVRKVVRTPAGEIEFIVGYSQWWGWFGRLVAVPLEALGIEGGHLVSLDMSPSKYAAAPTWHDTGATPLPADATGARRAVPQLIHLEGGCIANSVMSPFAQVSEIAPCQRYVCGPDQSRHWRGFPSDGTLVGHCPFHSGRTTRPLWKQCAAHFTFW